MASCLAALSNNKIHTNIGRPRCFVRAGYRPKYNRTCVLGATRVTGWVALP